VLIVPAAILAIVSVRLGGVTHVHHEDAAVGSETI